MICSKQNKITHWYLSKSRASVLLFFYANAIRKIDKTANAIPSKLSLLSFSLKTMYPMAAAKTTILALNTGIKTEIGKTNNPLMKKIVENQLNILRINPAIKSRPRILHFLRMHWNDKIARPITNAVKNVITK